MKQYNLLFLFATMLFLSACSEDFFEQTVEIDLPEHIPQLAITSQMAASDSAVWLYLTQSQGILENGQPDYIEDATVELFKNGELWQTLPYVDDRFYANELNEAIGQEPATYQFRVSATGFPDLEASQVMPSAVPIINATYEPEGALDLDGERVDEINIEFEDIGGEDNYYQISVYVESEFWSNNVYLTPLDPIAEELSGKQFLKDDSFDGKKYTWRVGMYPYELSPGEDQEIVVRLQSISRDKYFYERSVSLASEANDNPFAEPVIVYSNVTDGLGVFSLSSISEVVIEP